MSVSFFKAKISTKRRKLMWRFTKTGFTVAVTVFLAGCQTLEAPPKRDSQRVDATRRNDRPVQAKPPSSSVGDRIRDAMTPDTMSGSPGRQSINGAPRLVDLSAFQGPPRWKPGPMVVSRWSGHSPQDPKQEAALWRLAEQNLGQRDFFAFKSRLRSKGDIVICKYRKAGLAASERANYTMDVQFWQAGRRTQLHPEMLVAIETDPLMDAEITTCPPTLGEAVEMVDPQTYWQQARALWKSEQERESKRRLGGEYVPSNQYVSWKDNARQLSADQNRSLINKVKDGIDELEHRNRSLSVEDAQVLIHQKITPHFTELAKSGFAEAQAIPTGLGGRSRFIAWDRGSGRAVMESSLRFRTIWRELWGTHPLYFNVWETYIATYAEQLKDKGAFDPGFANALTTSLAVYKRDLANTPEPTPAYQRQNMVLVMRPRQSALYETLRSGSQLLGQLAATRGRTQRYLLELDQAIENTRNALWACHDRRCADGGKIFYQFSVLLLERDQFHVQKRAMEGMWDSASDGKYGQFVMDLLGAGVSRNGGATPGCEAQFSRFLEQFRGKFTVAGLSALKSQDETWNSDKYLQYQQCRDMMEFIWRPRGS